MSKAEREAFVIREWASARTIWEAADVVGCRANTIGVYARQLGLPIRGKGRKRRLK
jgi:hypothetical protein